MGIANHISLERARRTRDNRINCGLNKNLMHDNATELLTLASQGNSSALDRLMPLVYDELRGLGEHYLRNERANHTLEPTALVNEAYLRLVDHKKMNDKGRATFLAVAANAMRRVLIDHARKKKAIKRGRDFKKMTLNGMALTEDRELDFVDFEAILTKLGELDPRMSRVVELRFLGGLSEVEIGQTLGVSERTVREVWKAAKAWIQWELEGNEEG